MKKTRRWVESVTFELRDNGYKITVNPTDTTLYTAYVRYNVIETTVTEITRGDCICPRFVDAGKQVGDSFANVGN